MCGIDGIAGRHNPEWVEQMNDTLVHRGPDDQGRYHAADGLVSLAMRRLSIIDITGGHQPMSNADETIWIVFNGEIFNAPEIRRRLENRGCRFATTNSDTEALLHLYEEKGFSLVEELNGMFAFVIYDQRRQLLFGARDRMGIKPLYYWHGNGRFAFASELKSLLRLPFVERELDAQSLFDYMTLLYVPDEQSIIKGIRRIPPAHRFVYELRTDRLNIDRYWQLKFQPEENHSESEWAEILRLELRDAVKRWALSDVPIACSLSGGLDSSSIVGLLHELGFGKIKTFSLGFLGQGEESWSEVHLARQVAERWETEHRECFLRPEELMDDLMSMVWYLDEPYGGGLPSWYVFREMGKEVKVGLTGTGGDELFGNYGRYCAYETNTRMGHLVALRRKAKRTTDLMASLIALSTPLTECLPSNWRWIGRGRALSQVPRALRQPFGIYYHLLRQNFGDDVKRLEVLNSKNGDLQDTGAYLQGLFDGSQASDLRNGLAAVDTRSQLAEEFLFMTDRFSMAHSLEARVPFLDSILVEKVFRIPSSIRSKSTDLKYLLKRAIADLLPEDLLTAPKKGFVIPLELWLRGELRPLVKQLLNTERLRRQGIFQPQFYDTFVLPHLDGRAVFTWQIWAALMFQLWHIVFIDQKETTAPTYTWRDLC